MRAVEFKTNFAKEDSFLSPSEISLPEILFLLIGFGKGLDKRTSRLRRELLPISCKFLQSFPPNCLFYSLKRSIALSDTFRVLFPDCDGTLAFL